MATSSLINRHAWIPRVMLILCLSMFLAALRGPHLFWEFASGLALAFSSYVYGYSERAFRVIDYPSLLHLPRRQYTAVWDALAATPELAKAVACGHRDESAVRRSAQTPVTALIELVGICPSDDVLEFGCGVARIGRELIPRCRSWTGADLSANMLSTAAQRLQGLSNFRLIQLQQVGLDQIKANSFDVVYSTNMLAHLDGMDRWCYVRDAFRVLRPGGRLFIDNVDLESEEGWAAFARGTDSSQKLERPPYTPTLSTAAELSTYAQRAGFIDIHAHKRSPLVIVTARKPMAGNAGNCSSRRNPSVTAQS